MAASRFSRLLANIVLARLLAIEVFGIVGMANAVILLISALREAGLGQAYVQRRPLDDERPTEAVDTLFSAMLALNVLLFLATIGVAPGIAAFFESDASAVLPVVRVLAVLFLLDTFVSTPMFVLQRRMAFDGIARSELSGALTHAIVACGTAALGAGVWSLVLGQLGERIVMGVSLAINARWRPRLRGSRRVARGLLDFGKYLWGYALVRSLGEVMDRIVVGKVYGSGGLGGYSQAFNLCNLPASIIAQLVNRVALPAMARMKSDPARLRAAFLKSLEHVAFLALPTGIGLISVSDLVVPVVYGDKWRPIVPLVDVLAIYGVVLAMASVCGPALQALGRTRVFFFTELGRQGLLTALLVLFASRGERAVACTVLAALGVASAIAFTVLARLLAIRWGQLLLPLTRSLAASVGMLLAVFAVRRAAAASLGEGAELALAVAVGALGYTGFSYATNALMVQSFVRTLREVRSSRKAAR